MTKTELLDRARIKSNAANRRKKENRLAGELRNRGWEALSPYADDPITEAQIEAARNLLARAGWDAQPIGGVE